VRTTLLLLIVTLFLAPAGVADLSAQEEQQVFLSLVDRTGAPVTDITLDEVTIQEDGVPRDTLRVEPIDWPTKLTVIVDNSQATVNALVQLRNGLRGLFEELPAGVEMSLLTLAPQPRWIARPTRDRQRVIESIGLLTPDSGAAKFLDALVEAGNRIAKDEGNHFPVILIIGSDGIEGSSVIERDIDRLVKQMVQHAVTLHVVMIARGGRRNLSNTGANQVQVGIGLTQMTSGRYENIAASTRLATLLPELGKMIGESHLRQSQQYRVTYTRPRISYQKPGGPQITASTTRSGLTGVLTYDGRIPQP
jgi:hypothetical protein